MSEAPDPIEADDIDLSDVPMDDADDSAAADQGEEGKDGAKPAPKAALSGEELERRASNARIALSTERAKRREAERELADLRAGRSTERQPQRQDAAEDVDIDPEVDPVGALKQATAKIKAYEAAQRIEDRSAAEQTQREAQYRRVEEALQEHELDFAEDHPDYGEAAKHYAVTRAQELMQFGLQPKQIQPMLREEFATLAATAIKAGKNPAAVVYEMAKGRGFGKAAPADKGGKTKLDDIARGQRATSPLGRAGGRSSSGLDASTVGNINIRTKAGKDAFTKAFDAMEARGKAAERA